MKLLYSILWKDHSRTHLLFAFLGTLAGFILLLSGLQFYRDIRQVMVDNSDLLDPEYIVLNKKVNLGGALGVSSPGFSREEVDEITAMPFTRQVSPFLFNRFPIQGFTDNEQIPGFYTELFFEAIPDEYLDIQAGDWNWDPEKGLIPIVIPQDFLNLYNFGFAQSQGLPQIPKEVVSMLKFRIRMNGIEGQDDYEGRIVGFSNRIQSILVPYDFLEWANDKYGYFERDEPSRLILVSKDPTDPEIVRFIEDRGYDTIKEKLKSSRMNIILKFIIRFLVVVAGLILLLAFLVFLLSLQLMISRSSGHIRRLHRLGFHPLEISRPYIVLLSILLLAVTLLSLLSTSLITHRLAVMGAEWNLGISESLHPLVYGIALVLIFLIFAINLAAILISTKKLCK